VAFLYGYIVVAGIAGERKPWGIVMKTIVLLTMALTSAVTLFGCRVPSAPEASSDAPGSGTYQTITPQAAKAQLDADPAIILVDVRTEAEYLEQHIPNSLLIPDYAIATLAPKLLMHKDAKIIIYCRSGRRSREAAQALLQMGYTNVHDLGGIINWPYATVAGK
jgi:phage shock protein E